jgi:glycosyltransferase involved in cell wall biosynthesis
VKVSILGPAYPLRGGIAHHVCCIERAAREAGHAVQVITFERLYPSLLFPGRTILDEESEAPTGMAARLLDPIRPWTWFRALRRVREFGAERAILEYWQPFFAPMLGTIARRLGRLGVSPVLDVHNPMPHERTPLARPLLRYALGGVDRAVTHSEENRRVLLGMSPRADVRVAPLPALRELAGATASDRGGRTLLFFGHVRRYKGLDVLLRAMPLVLRREECRLVVAGEFYDPIERYEAIVREAGIDRHVEIHPRYVSNAEAARLVAAADVLVLPYTTATQSAVLRVAAENALPAIASRAGALAESIEHDVTGLLVPPGDPDALAAAVVRYFEEGLGPPMAAALRARAPQRAEAARTLLAALLD